MEKIIYEEEKRVSIYGNIENKLIPLPHYHKEIEIIYIKEGNTTAYADNKKYDMKSGDIFISFPNQVHYYENTSIGNYYLFIISPKVFYIINTVLNKFLPNKNSIDISNDIQISEFIELSMIASKSENDKLKSVGYMSIVLNQLLPQMELSITQTDDRDILLEIIDYCNQHYFEEITLPKLSKQLNLSQYHLSRIINSKFNMGLNDYVNRIRISAAKDLLLETSKKTIEISEEVGFGSVRSFNRAFRKAMQLTPLEYKASQKEKINFQK